MLNNLSATLYFVNSYVTVEKLLNFRSKHENYRNML
jgi:hypothetical protein